MYFCAIILLMLKAISFNVYGLVVRDTSSDISTNKGGVLVKNGVQTSCELGVIDSTAAFVAAPCLDFVGDKVSYSTTYEVYLDAGINNTPAKYKVDSITVHPYYNSTYYFNPIAILRFNSASTESWSNPIAIDQFNGWGDILFIRRGMTNISTMDWNVPTIATNQYTNVSGCKHNNRVFDANQNNILCSNALALSMNSFLSHCAIPFGSVSVYINKKLYVAGFHVYSISSSIYDKCVLNAGQSSFYLLFANYIAFANKVLVRDISYYPNSKGITYQKNTNYSMNSSPDNLLTKIIPSSGDLLSNKYNRPLAESSQPTADVFDLPQSLSSVNASILGSSVDLDTASDSIAKVISSTDIIQISETASDTLGYDNNSHDNNHNTFSKNLIIGIVCGVFGGLLLTIVFLYAYKKWKRAHRNIYKGRNMQDSIHSMLVIDTASIYRPSSIYLPETPVHKSNKQTVSAFEPPTSAQSGSTIVSRSTPRSTVNNLLSPYRFSLYSPSLFSPKNPN